MLDRDVEIKTAVQSIYNDMVEDFVLTVAISAHRHHKRSKTICGTCGTFCRSSAPISTAPTATSSSSGSNLLACAPREVPSRPSSPQPPGASQEARSGGYTVGPEKGTGGSTGIGSGSGRIDTSGNAFFDCLVCGRAIASTRYAPHLSSCLGLNGSTRRGAARSAAAKVRMGTNDRSSPSPYLQSENGDSDVDSNSSKKVKKAVNGNGKRGASPSKPPSGLGKKAKFSSGVATPNTGRPALPPSRLGRPPKNRSPSRQNSPNSIGSPTYSIVSSQGTAFGGVGRKILPGQSMETAVVIDDDAPREDYVPGDESSEGPDDY